MLPRNDERVSSEADEAERDLLSRSRREVTEELVLSALRAQEAVDKAEEREAALLATAQLRELLLGIIGHDLRNPLSAMMMSVGILLARGNLNLEDARLAGSVLKSGVRMNGMISQILEFTRSRLGGGFLLDRRKVSLGTVCRTVAAELELAAAVRLECTEDGDVTGNWDADRLAQVLSNIAANAIEHAREGTRVSLHAQDAGADVIVEICNQGNPIPLDVLPFIFEPFRRAKERQPSKTGNLGLGLYIAHEIVRAHGGALVATSADGRTTFTTRLPRS